MGFERGGCAVRMDGGWIGISRILDVACCMLRVIYRICVAWHQEEEKEDRLHDFYIGVVR